MKVEIRRLNEPLHVGSIYTQHGAQYLVMEHLDVSASDKMKENAEEKM